MSKEEFFESIKVGDIFVDSWGYGQTNQDFYLVTKKLKASIKIVEIGSKVVSRRANGYTSVGIEMVVPVPDAVIGEEKIKFPQDGYIRTRSFSIARLWDGKPMYETAAGWGH